MRYEIISLANKFRKANLPTHDVLEKISSQIDTATAEYKAENCKEKPTPVIRGVLNRPEAEIANEQAHHTRHEGRDRVRLAVEIIALGIGAIVAVANIALWVQTKESTRIAGIAAQAAQNSAAASASQAEISKQSAEAAVHNFRVEQRAWVSVTNVTITAQVGNPFQINIGFANIGKSVAMDMDGTAVVDPIPKGSEPNFDYSKEKHIRVGYFPPNLPDHFPLKMERPFTQFGHDQMTNGNLVVYAHGIIHYSDIFGVRHWTRFCYFADAEHDAVALCKNPKWNDADTNPD
jgi:hypothetical protein